LSTGGGKYDVGMGEEYSERAPHSGQHISELLDNLICALYEQRARQHRLYEFKATRRAPRSSQVFEDVHTLAEYNNDKARYEQELEAITYQKEAPMRRSGSWSRA